MVYLFWQVYGVLRGLIRDGYAVTKGFKIADIDPRVEEQKNCYTISGQSPLYCRWCVGMYILAKEF